MGKATGLQSGHALALSSPGLPQTPCALTTLIIAERKALDTLRRKLLGVGSGVSLEAIDTAWRDWRLLAGAVASWTNWRARGAAVEPAK